MRLSIALFLTVVLLAAAGCAQRRDYAGARNQEVATQSGSAGRSSTEAPAAAVQEQREGFKKVSLAQADQSQASAAAVERKIVRNAELTLEVAAPTEAQRKVAAVADARGGFVVTSEARQNDERNTSQPAEVVTIVMRVPASQFDAAVGEIRAVGNRVRQEKTTGQDVTEEYIDLEARLRTQRALEAQFLEIMKQAQKVSDALEVNRQLAEVRGVIEQVEGRRRFLENQAALSTINVTLQTPAPLIGTNTTGFFAGIKEALGDGVDIAATIILVLIRLVIALVPVLLFIVLPLVLLLRFWRRRHPRQPRHRRSWSHQQNHVKFRQPVNIQPAWPLNLCAAQFSY